jgi:hypothetical protein
VRNKMQRSFLGLALVVAATLLGACAHAGRRSVLTPDDQLVAAALSWAVRVPPPVAEYRVEVPAGYARDAILAAAAADVRLIRRGATLRRAGERVFRDSARITVRTPEGAAAAATAPEFRVPFKVTVGGAKPIDCVVRIRHTTDDPRSWFSAAERGGDEHCWPRPGAFAP